MEKIICFSLGLSREDIEKGKISFCEVRPEKIELEVIPLMKTGCLWEWEKYWNECRRAGWGRTM